MALDDLCNAAASFWRSCICCLHLQRANLPGGIIPAVEAQFPDVAALAGAFKALLQP